MWAFSSSALSPGATTSVHLSDEEIKSLDDVSALSMEYPGWMIANSEASRRKLLATGLVAESHV
jgi:hypothetical protein